MIFQIRMAEFAWRTIILEELRPLSNQIFLSIFLMSDCKKTYEIIGHHAFRNFAQFLRQEIQDGIEKDTGEVESPDHLIRTHKGKFHLQHCLVECFYKRFEETARYYTLHNGKYMTKHAAFLEGDKPVIRI
jgi:hypothetical protein